MKILNSYWQATMGSKSFSGIIIAENDIGKKYAYVGSVDESHGSERKDAEWICSGGQKYDINYLIKMLEENK